MPNHFYFPSPFFGKDYLNPIDCIHIHLNIYIIYEFWIDFFGTAEETAATTWLFTTKGSPLTAFESQGPPVPRPVRRCASYRPALLGGGRRANRFRFVIFLWCFFGFVCCFMVFVACFLWCFSLFYGVCCLFSTVFFCLLIFFCGGGGGCFLVFLFRGL